MKWLLPIFIIIFHLSSCRAKIDRDRIIRIGESLVNIDASKSQKPVISDVVSIGDHLIEKLLFLRTKSSSYRFKVESGDLREPYGNNKGDCILTIETDFQNVGIRLKYNKQEDKYDILGFMTL